ncbi:MAG: glucose-1-phosphate cytidylyltransferase [Leptospiraceae bacterium]|nr:glucose-1-phosphate cytidylyltransferase [Leptospiraceae bacterium]
MKVGILCGGLGTRLSEETVIKPKPMVEIGGYPILWHIMKLYASAGFEEFVLALGYKGEVIKDFFINYHPRSSDVTVKLRTGEVDYHNTTAEDFTVRMIETGAETMTGGRLLRMKSYLGNGTFMLTYGDGVCDVDLNRLLAFHRAHGGLATMTAVRPPARFGTMRFDGDRVIEFEEKPQTGEGWINGGFFVLEPGVFDYLSSDADILEKRPLENLARDGQLHAYRHEGFWKCMDTVRDRNVLEEIWADGNAPWKQW